ncbi:MAG: P-II family nitrogen regulator [Candidatus Latescibacterota bacterium]
MKLFVFICNQPEKLEEILEGFLEVGITGATVIDSMGMGRILATEVPIFAGLRESFFGAATSSNKTILSVIRDSDKIQAAYDMIEEICGKLDDPGAGIAFTIPVEQAMGLMPEIQ